MRRLVYYAFNALTSIIVGSWLVGMATERNPAMLPSRMHVTITLVCVGTWLGTLVYSAARWRFRPLEVPPWIKR